MYVELFNLNKKHLIHASIKTKQLHLTSFFLIFHLSSAQASPNPLKIQIPAKSVIHHLWQQTTQEGGDEDNGRERFALCNETKTHFFLLSLQLLKQSRKVPD